MSKILIYHHCDNDGYLAAAIADDFLKVTNNNIEFRVGKYDGVHDEEALKWADFVYVLDYTLPMPLMDRYFDKIIWIDHHKTAIESMTKIEENRRKFEGLRAIGKSGALLTWIYFYGRDAKVPRVVDLVNDRDVWDWQLGEPTAAFHEASRMFMPYYGEWQAMLDNDKLTEEKVGYGFTLLTFIRHIIDVYNSSYAWDGMFEGHYVVFLNGTGALSGELHKRLRESYPETKFAVVFMVRADKVTVGMYRQDGVTDVSLGKIAQKYGGGGHDGAAGFYTDHDEWTKVIKESKYAPGYRR